jgi:hypothetical protein
MIIMLVPQILAVHPLAVVLPTLPAMTTTNALSILVTKPLVANIKIIAQIVMIKTLALQTLVHLLLDALTFPKSAIFATPQVVTRHVPPPMVVYVTL